MNANGKPRVGFVGTGWIGLNRMTALVGCGLIEAAAILEPSDEMRARAVELAPAAAVVSDLDALLAVGLDGVVVATPSAMHAGQAVRALEAGAAVFCQKPLGRDAGEVRAVVEAARRADRLLAVDLSYRFTDGMRRVRDLVRSGALGQVFAIDLAFHNAYGPDKPWFYDPTLSGGGCVMDLGIHLVDLALWTTGCSEAADVRSTLVSGGVRLRPADARAEDYAVASFDLATGAAVRIACSWRLHAGRDAVISAAFHGTEGGAEFRNVQGSFYDFVAEHHRGTARELLSGPPDPWGGRAAISWAGRLAAGERFAPDEAEEFVRSAEVIDAIYGRAA